MVTSAPKIPHDGCSWLLMVAEHGDGTKPHAGHLACPACGKQVPATPEQIAQAVEADTAWFASQEHG